VRIRVVELRSQEGAKGFVRSAVLVHPAGLARTSTNLLGMNDNGAPEFIRRAAPFVPSCEKAVQA
jgi:hypothetical protein